MANETQITLIGNATHVELRFTQSGRAVANFSLATTPRTFNRQTNEWEDLETIWLNCSVWGQAAENLAETYDNAKSMRVILQGRLRARSYDDREGNRRTVFEVQVDEIGPSLQWATAQVTRTSSGGGQQPRQQAQGGGQPQAPRQRQTRQQQRQAPQGGDPWANDEEPPF